VKNVGKSNGNDHTNGYEKGKEGLSSAPVIIAGAGPVGCALALYLVKKNIPIILLELEKDLPEDLRASTFHPPTLDLLDQLQLTEKLIPQGLLVHDYQYRDRRTNEIAKFNFTSLIGETKHPYRLQCEQFKMTRTVVELLKDYPHANVRFETKVKGYRQHDKGVRVLCANQNDEIHLDGSYLIGTDGANSIVRQASGVKFEGLTYPERFLVVSTKYPFENYFDNLSYVNYVSDPNEWCVILKTVDLWRVLVPTEPEADPDILLSDAFIEDRLQRLAPKAEPYEIAHRTLYRVHQRVAETYRPERKILLAGDAAHINNPLGGMGMNGGLHDAFNLGEKLTQIIKHGEDEDVLLDQYDRQRRGICVDFVQKHTLRNKALMEATDINVQTARQQEFMKACSDPVLTKAFLLRTSMIDCLKDSYEIA